MSKRRGLKMAAVAVGVVIAMAVGALLVQAEDRSSETLLSYVAGVEAGTQTPRSANRRV